MKAKAKAKAKRKSASKGKFTDLQFFREPIVNGLVDFTDTCFTSKEAQTAPLVGLIFGCGQLDMIARVHGVIRLYQKGKISPEELSDVLNRFMSEADALVTQKIEEETVT